MRDRLLMPTIAVRCEIYSIDVYARKGVFNFTIRKISLKYAIVNLN